MSTELVFTKDSYKGVVLDTSHQELGPDEFVEKLKEAIVQWKTEGKRGLWLKAHKEQCIVIPKIIELGFDFHHAKPGYVCLTKWLSEDVPNHIPGYANHYLGVAGFVVNDQNQILVIREVFTIQNRVSVWKLPGGLADAGEEIKTTAIREVREETGIETEFVCVIAYRHLHNYRHGCSDFYHVCLMRPLTTEIKACPVEIQDCQWMDLNEYENLDGTSDVNRFFVQKYREMISTGYGIAAGTVLSYDKKSLNTVYSVGKIDQVNNV
ncbi:uncharacterized protein LOC131931784 isoform X2 [Physella acuta]|uniref:uncharacterized protein LOC131931784 isoform X2 n=1 Tax=Physella acuta TaxID=109671 RepID=UPI0027DB3D36|nr:uncharacterized protein LOC131931784 isoform X2 [Physella acuta]